MNRKLKDEDMDILFRGILKLSTVEECYDFFEDLCTISELRAMVQRFQVARNHQPCQQMPCVRLGRLPQNARPAEGGQ